MQVPQNKTSSWSSTDSHPSDKNKDVRWMGHSFIPRGSLRPVDDYEVTISPKSAMPEKPPRTL